MPMPVNTNQEEFLPSFDDIAKKACAATGGQWDEQNQICRDPQRGRLPGGIGGVVGRICLKQEEYNELTPKMELYAWIAGGVTLGFLLGSWK